MTYTRHVTFFVTLTAWACESVEMSMGRGKIPSKYGIDLPRNTYPTCCFRQGTRIEQHKMVQLEL